MTYSAGQLETLVKQAAIEAGFDLAGIAPARLGDSRELRFFSDWVAAGRAGEMAYLESRDGQGRLKRAALEHVAPWARSVVVCALNYNTAHPRSTECHAPDRGWISRYAWGPADYHSVIMERLRRVEARLREEIGDPAIEMRCYVDTGPVVERVFAAYAGMGWIGKNTCLINQRVGSWLFLGVILTSLELAPDLPAADRCGSCTRCLDACPTQAFVAPRELDATRCISYLTIEKRGAIPEELRPGMGNHVFGCDICQDVCPWNRKAPASQAPEFQPRQERFHPALAWLGALSEEEFRTAFRGSPIRRARRSGLRRNAVVAMGNSGQRGSVPFLQQLARDPDPVVAEHAEWALKRCTEYRVSSDQSRMIQTRY
ncbi:MAG TPA: tRNA epoxyqueuosine(34) reductase QueG [Terriglobales bacterium]|nr:tRNA epoxyqueuosine(34) reductase QueG [Terriglobales bacterium]